ncbi:oxidoreductase [Streptomyces paludis]|uniref:Oxidoreductase n=1 Tax=Streptomyces paludis TaxID=2282738 RepID=A0A345HKK8_9ACTN|nr:oxidoreductase [Streptomyces paludis]
MIPLGPLRVSDILNGAFTTIGRYWKQLLGTALAAYGVAAFLMIAAGFIAYASVSDQARAVFNMRGADEPTWPEIRPLLIAFACFWIVSVALVVLANVVIQTACPAIVQQAVLGRPITIDETARRAASRLGSVLGTVLLTVLIALPPIILFLIGFAGLLFLPNQVDEWPFEGPKWLFPVGMLGALALMPLSAWLWTRFSLAPSVAVIESSGPVASMRRSARLVDGAWWRIFGISLLGYALASVAAAMIQQVVNVVGLLSGQLTLTTSESRSPATQFLAFMGIYMVITLVAGVISQIITATLPQLVVNLLYVDQRIRNENLAPVLADAAGVTPAMGTPGTPPTH